jgi:hypothetical protein
MKAFRMRLETAKAKRAARKALKKSIDKTFNEVIADLRTHAKEGKTQSPKVYDFETMATRNAVGSRLVNCGYKVEYVWEQPKLQNIGWAK